MASSENPFAALQLNATVENFDRGVLGLESAGKGARFVNFLIDGILLRVVTFGVGFVIGFVWLIVLEGDEATLDSLEFNLFGFAIGISLFLAYYVLLEGLTGRTIAKFLTGTIVVDQQGRKPKMGQIVGRSFARLIPFEPFSFLGSGPNGWHDNLSQTMVVKAR